MAHRLGRATKVRYIQLLGRVSEAGWGRTRGGGTRVAEILCLEGRSLGLGELTFMDLLSARPKVKSLFL